jgi:transcriptional regulator with XRE-family HTH domain
MNRISKILAQKGISEVRPTDEALAKLGVNIKTWNKWVENKKDPELDQLQAIADFLDCEPADLVETRTTSSHAL